MLNIANKVYETDIVFFSVLKWLI